jgi:hypothetical protein
VGSQQPPRERRPFEKGKRLNTSIFYPIVAIVGAVVTGVLMFGLLRVLMPLGIRYELAAEGIEVHFLGNVAVWKIKYHSVDSLKKVHFPTSAMWAIDPTVLRLGNRFIGDGVLIRRKSGLLRKIVITSESPDEFVMSVSAQLEHLFPH